MRVVERPFSDLLRHPNDVTGELDSSDVLLRRRDEPDLRLSLADRDEGRVDAFRALAASFRHLAQHSPKVLDGAVLDAFAWSEFLPAKDRSVFVEEFSKALVASAEIDVYTRLAQLVREWKATAEIHADPALARRLKRSARPGERAGRVESVSP